MNGFPYDSLPNRPIDVVSLRRTLGAFVTGVTVVTTLDSVGQPRGLTANSFTSVSLDPPLVLVCVSGTASSYPAFSACESFAINILAEGQEEISNRFASTRPDKFADIGWSEVATGAPILDQSLAWLDCRVFRKTIAGDHLILIGRVEDFSCGTSRPLAYCQGNYVNFGLEQVAVSQHLNKRVLVAWVIESGGRILLARQDLGGATERWSIPMSPLGPAQQTAQTIRDAARQSVGAEVDISFLYSMIEFPDEEALCLVYRGQAPAATEGVRQVGDRIEAVAADEIPWEHIPDRHIRNMLRRYLQERVTDRFGIYLGSVDEGRVASVDPDESWTTHALKLSGIESASPPIHNPTTESASDR
jgi:flavin reductase (DIM6/NTAB) family NADH-FMN oxidoreductase RutF